MWSRWSARTYRWNGHRLPMPPQARKKSLNFLAPLATPRRSKNSITDPYAALSSKRGASEFAYYDNYLIDNQSCIIAGVMATPARLNQEIIAARHMLERVKERFGLQPESVAADKSYGTASFCLGSSNGRLRQTFPCWVANSRPRVL